MEGFDDYNNFSSSGSGDEFDNKKIKILNDDKKRYTKPAIVRLEYKTRYNNSKIVNKKQNLFNFYLIFNSPIQDII